MGSEKSLQEVNHRWASQALQYRCPDKRFTPRKEVRRFDFPSPANQMPRQDVRPANSGHRFPERFLWCRNSKSKRQVWVELFKNSRTLILQKLEARITTCRNK